MSEPNQDSVNDKLDEALKAWAEAEAAADPGANCPVISVLWLHETEDRPLGEWEEHVQACQRCQRRLELIRTQSRRPVRLHFWKPGVRRVVMVGSVAAAVLIAVVLVWRSTPKALADVYADAANAGTALFYFLKDATVLLDDDPALLEQHRQALEAAEHKRDQALAAVERDPDNIHAPTMKALQAWQAVYCEYRALGLRDSAVAENRAALAYDRDNPTGRPIGNWEAILLDGLGNTLAMFGDYGGARQAYVDSLELRLASGGHKPDPHRGEPGYEGHLAQEVVLFYFRLVMLSVAEDDLPQAWQWQVKAEKAMRDKLSTTCELNGVAFPKDASVWQLWRALPAEYHDPKPVYSIEERQQWPQAWHVYEPGESCFHLLGALLYHEAILHRLAGDHAAAWQALERVETMEDWLTQNPGNDEYRLPLVLHIERARLAIINKDFPQALAHLEAAEAYLAAVRELFAKQASGEIDEPRPAPDVNKLPISPSRRAELNLLRGIALRGQDPGNKEAQRLIKKALAVPQRMAERMTAVDRDRFWRQFEAWRRLAEHAGHRDLQWGNKETQP